MGIVIPFEVVRQGKPETDEEKRIEEKEAIYRELIEVEAIKYGRTFEEMKIIEDQEHQESDAKHPNLYTRLSKQKGITIYEAQLDVRIGFLQALNKYAPDYRDATHFTKG